MALFPRSPIQGTLSYSAQGKIVAFLGMRGLPVILAIPPHREWPHVRGRATPPFLLFTPDDIGRFATPDPEKTIEGGRLIIQDKRKVVDFDCTVMAAY